MSRWILPSYEPATCCPGTNCYLGSKAEPCWGKVDVRDEDEEGDWVHGCLGHAAVAQREGPYRPSDMPEDQGKQPTEIP